jgi:hypothetical protein
MRQAAAGARDQEAVYLGQMHPVDDIRWLRRD